MFKELLTSLRAILALTVLTCVIYPLAVTGLSQAAFPKQANGSLVRDGGRLVGSELLAQKFTAPQYFWPRPSAADYGTVASGSSNQGFTSQKLKDAVAERRALYGENAPADLLSASASGLDPDISPAALLAQLPRVAAARGLQPAALTALVEQSLTKPQLGFLGQPRFNVLQLNRALDQMAHRR